MGFKEFVKDSNYKSPPRTTPTSILICPEEEFKCEVCRFNNTDNHACKDINEIFKADECNAYRSGDIVSKFHLTEPSVDMPDRHKKLNQLILLLNKKKELDYGIKFTYKDYFINHVFLRSDYSTAIDEDKQLVRFQKRLSVLNKDLKEYLKDFPIEGKTTNQIIDEFLSQCSKTALDNKTLLQYKAILDFYFKKQPINIVFTKRGTHQTIRKKYKSWKTALDDYHKLKKIYQANPNFISYCSKETNVPANRIRYLIKFNDSKYFTKYDFLNMGIKEDTDIKNIFKKMARN